MLTPYDEYPVHQSPYPFSRVATSDLSWNDGYYFGVYNAEKRVFLYTGMRVTPNAGVVGFHAGVSVAGLQTTVRGSRQWWPDFRTLVGPLSYEFTAPFERMHLSLARSDAPLSFDLDWIALAEAHIEDHHFAETKGRVTTDQTRYTQVGTAEGWIELGTEKYEVNPEEWYAVRDHSWGIYEPRTPLDPKEWVAPREPSDRPRMLRFWMPFQTPEYTGFYHFHEDEFGGRGRLNDVFGTPFEGAIDVKSTGERIRLVDGRHELRFVPGTRQLAGGSVELEDEHGDTWRQTFEVACPPWTTFPIGYYDGTWKDGGTIHTYHATPPGEDYSEWDVVDFSSQPAEYQAYGGRLYEDVYGGEYLTTIEMDGPHGLASGQAQIEFFMHRAYRPYREQRD